MTEFPRFTLAQEEAFASWLVERPRALVLYRGVGCPYSAAFEKVFADVSPRGVPRAIREVEEGGHGPIAEALGIDLTPTVGDFDEGTEERIEARLLVGITRERYQTWLSER